MTVPSPHHIAAILPCSDLDASTAFYARLGLDVVADHGRYRLLSNRKGWHLHLTDETQPTWPERDQNPFGLYLYSDDVDALAESVRDVIIGPIKAPTHKPWGMYEFAVSDPDETLVRVGWPSEDMG
ncbi:MAG: VOC family protein [Sphingopyxis sp.]|uniref:VOC family protein n=1 Tax=Sphingopyxis sp. TaxID=1908224 RepID=UPI002ABA9926|nr:VOC family protein [Sphingopyxis sp.]MDZ3833374.1 VOC family protein [Sphingopyxis sp.]